MYRRHQQEGEQENKARDEKKINDFLQIHDLWTWEINCLVNEHRIVESTFTYYSVGLYWTHWMRLLNSKCFLKLDASQRSTENSAKITIIGFCHFILRATRWSSSHATLENRFCSVHSLLKRSGASLCSSSEFSMDIYESNLSISREIQNSFKANFKQISLSFKIIVNLNGANFK